MNARQSSAGLGEDRVPQWFHSNITDTKLSVADRRSRIAIISVGAANLIIRPAESIVPRKPGWALEWEILGCLSPKDGWGRVYFDDFDLAAAFGLSGSKGEFNHSSLCQYAPDSADPGKYIRTGKFLNIPCPDTEFNCGTNVSIRITSEIQEAVKELLL